MNSTIIKSIGARQISIHLVLILLVLTSCSHQIVRTGYSASTDRTEECDVKITTDPSLVGNKKAVGVIKLRDSGFSTKCSEDIAMDVLRKEACAANANLVLITEETPPDLLSNCYRCDASFYRISPDSIGTEEYYMSDYNAYSEMVESKKNNKGLKALAIAGSFAVSFAIGFTIAYLATTN